MLIELFLAELDFLLDLDFLEIAANDLLEFFFVADFFDLPTILCF